ncbi:unnamed protein product [Oppiella nova]|uniref:Uncharacterized protein n=1 Tax=Oppiella nova TaxID=334625 RepID=A0A7R9QRX2_9ACAR|nr:unnamed protein product [Oppiella nova]CAG2172775.1 unnamed protein product [Oppiella nova]
MIVVACESNARMVETYLYRISKLSGDKVYIGCDGYKVGDWLGIGCSYNIAFSSAQPEYNDRLLQVDLYKDDIPFLRVFNEGPKRYATNPVKGIDLGKMEFDMFMDYAVITNTTGANNETAGAYRCILK